MSTTTNTMLSETSIHIPINPLLIFSLFALLLACWLIFTIIVRYHWKKYGTGTLEIVTMNLFYFIGSLIIIGLGLVSALFYLS